MDYLDRYYYWILNDSFDEITKKELLEIEKNTNEIKDRFCKELEFGTGGLRGIMGAGTNRMNIYTVRKVTQGLANYILQQGGKEKGVVIAFDSRYMSQKFAICDALCLCANGIKTYLFDGIRPTPELSFAVRKLEAKAGIVITASHNPAEYNGYKVYYEDGAQITSPHDKNIQEEIRKISSCDEILTMSEKEALQLNLLKYIGEEIDDDYVLEVKRQIINDKLIKDMAKYIKIVYTPLHGTGNVIISRVLEELGFCNVYVVEEQEVPNGDFPTVDCPNPEDKGVFDLALKLANKVDADIILATDPDADRLGVYSKGENGEYVAFTGNMLGVLLSEYILKESSKKTLLPKNGVIVKTIVTTKMIDVIAKKYSITLKEVLTGFKYIGEQIKIFEQNKNFRFIFGFEESYGCLKGIYTRDKDACVAVLLVCEVCAYQKCYGKSIWDRMTELYREYGYFIEKSFSVVVNEIDGKKSSDSIVNKLSSKIIDKIGKYNILKIRDYANGTIFDITKNIIYKTNLPKSNVFFYELESDSWCCIRPSGTEKKVKVYIGVYDKNKSLAEKKINILRNELQKLLKFD